MARLPLGVMIGLGEGVETKLRALREVGFTTLQTYLAGPEFRTDPGLCSLKQTIAEAGFQVTSVAAAYPGEDYSDTAAVRRTVGLVPDEAREARVEATKRTADWARAMGAPNVSSHIGYIPEDRSHPVYRVLIAVLQEICDHLAGNGQSFNLETGQETAEALRTFIGDVNRANLGVNFDPANMILYGTGDPIEALTVLAPWVRGAHCKDGNWPTAAGQLGAEQRLDEGQVGIERFVAKLIEIGYAGPLTVEREVGEEQQMTDFLAAADLLKGIKAKLGVM